MSLESTMTRIEADAGASATSFVTASISPAANSLILLCVNSSNTNGGTAPTSITGGGMTTWDLVATAANRDNRVSIYRAQQASPGSGTITIDYGATTMTAINWAVYDIPGAIVGNNGAAAIGQTATNTASGVELSVALTTYEPNEMEFVSTIREANESPTNYPFYTLQRQWPASALSLANDMTSMFKASFLITWPSGTPPIAGVGLVVKNASGVQPSFRDFPKPKLKEVA